MKYSPIQFLIALAIVLPVATVRAESTMSMMPGAEWIKFGEPAKPTASVRTILITATDQRFIPDSVTVARGKTVTFKITNIGSLKHEFVIGDAAFHKQHQKEMAAMPDMEMDEANAVDISPRQTRTLTWHFTEPGDFVYACDIPHHAEAGMTGTIHVR